MVHTATLYFNDYPSVKEYFEILRFTEGTQWYRQQKQFVNTSFKSYGITEIAGREFVNKSGGLQHCLFIIVNFNKIATGNRSVSVMSENQLAEVKDNFDKIMNALGFPSFAEWHVLRIDYTVNVCTPFVEYYLDLLKKGLRPRNSHYSFRDWYDKDNRNYGQRKGSLYLVPDIKDRKKTKKTGSFVVNFYSKENQLRNEYEITEDLETLRSLQDPTEEQQLVIDSENILRLEIQCFPPRVKGIRQQEQLDSRSVYNYLNSEIAKKQILGVIHAISRDQDYFRKGIARKKIEESGYTRPVKADLIQIVNSCTRGLFALEQVRNQYKADNKLSVFRARMKAFDNLGINPVTISDQRGLVDESGNKITTLQNLQRLAISAFEQENQTEEEYRSVNQILKEIQQELDEIEDSKFKQFIEDSKGAE